eukprot:TRINITY_DN5005_c0_g1_i1.p2 TRINITY_DN5005_c0_g1~~TRINITY_DN5005_c0_g1_i1.p2  ORF type:complete len:102 (+),score=36.27 TRINITY_DN5005_c0_g1_i1:94-399(+)
MTHPTTAHHSDGFGSVDLGHMFAGGSKHGAGVATHACNKARADLCGVLDDKYQAAAGDFAKYSKRVAAAAQGMYSEAGHLKHDGCGAMQYPVVKKTTWHKV